MLINERGLLIDAKEIFVGSSGVFSFRFSSDISPRTFSMKAPEQVLRAEEILAIFYEPSRNGGSFTNAEDFSSLPRVSCPRLDRKYLPDRILLMSV